MLVLSSCPAPAFPAWVAWDVCADIFSDTLGTHFPSLSASPVISLFEGFIQLGWGSLVKTSLHILGTYLVSLMELFVQIDLAYNALL